MKLYKSICYSLLFIMISCDNSKIENIATTDENDSSAPAKISGLTTVSSSKKIVVSWKKPADNDISHIEVELKKGREQFKLSKPTFVSEISRSLIGLDNDIEYTIRIRAVDKSGNKGNYSNEIKETPTTGMPAYRTFATELNKNTDKNYSNLITKINNLITSSRVIVSDSTKDSLHYTLGSAYYLNNNYKKASESLKKSSATPAKSLSVISHFIHEDFRVSVNQLKQILVRKDRVLNGELVEFYLLPKKYLSSRFSKIGDVLSKKNILLSAATAAYLSNELKWAGHFLDTLEPIKWHSQRNPDLILRDIKRLSQMNKFKKNILQNIIEQLLLSS